MKVLITIVNYNTEELLAHLLFSLFRIVGHGPLRRCDIYVVDNNSSDNSVSIIKALEAKGLIKGIYNKKQRYHGPGLNQGLRIALKQNYDIFWAIDSDVVILRPRIIRDALNQFNRRGVDLLAQFNNASEGHVSCMLLRVDVARQLRACFCHGGNPSRYLEKQYRHAKAIVKNFPFRQSYYILHAGCGTRKIVKDTGDRTNAWFGDIADCSPWYHGDPLAPTIHGEFRQLFKRHIPQLTPEALCEACVRGRKVRLRLPGESPGIDPRVLSPTARGKRARRAKTAVDGPKSAVEKTRKSE